MSDFQSQNKFNLEKGIIDGFKATQYPDSLGDDVGILEHQSFQQRPDGYETPNFDRVANEGVSFTDYYGQQPSGQKMIKPTWGRPITRNGP
jgi:hypothetical protein